MVRRVCGALGCVALAVCVGVARADEGGQKLFMADLDMQPTAGIHAMVPQTIKLSPEKPAGVGKEPEYRNKPMYGVLKLGNAKNNQILVVLDTAKAAGIPHLFVDSNGNGDLTDDPTPELKPATTETGANKPGAGDSETRYTAIVPVVARYDVAGRGGTVASALQFTVWGSDVSYNREYGRTGQITLGKHTYRCALVDQTLSGVFNEFKHGEDEPARVTLLIDKNEDGQFDPRRETFDAAKPFRIGGGTYHVVSIDVRGTHLVVETTKDKVITPEDLKPGGPSIPFDAETTENKLINFPDDYKRKVVLLNFWATWNSPSLQELANVLQVYKRFHARGFEVLSVSLDRKNLGGRLAQYRERAGMKWPLIYDGGYVKAEIATLYGINALPMAFLVDGDSGKILAMGDILRGSTLMQAVEALLANKR